MYGAVGRLGLAALALATGCAMWHHAAEDEAAGADDRGGAGEGDAPASDDDLGADDPDGEQDGDGENGDDGFGDDSPADDDGEGSSSDPPAGTCGQPDYWTCTIDGATPLGLLDSSGLGSPNLVHAFTGGQLWGGPGCGRQLNLVFATHAVLRFSHDPTQPLPGPLQLHLISQLDEVSFEDPMPVHAILYEGDFIAETDGTLRLEQLFDNAGLLTGTFALEEGGWSVRGVFQAQHCPWLDDACL